jgi:ribosomal protein L29
MKTKEKKELFAKTETELRKALKEAKAALLDLVLDLGQNKLKNTSLISRKRKEVALIKTALREKELVK